MPNTIIPAAGEAMPVNRRLALLGGLSATAALAAVPRAHAGAEEGHDPLVDAVRAYRAGLADFNAKAPGDDETDAYAEVSYGRPMKLLEEWEEPAKTHRGALEALRLIAEPDGDGEIVMRSDDRSMRLPDADRVWASIGASYNWNERLSIDAPMHTSS